MRPFCGTLSSNGLHGDLVNGDAVVWFHGDMVIGEPSPLIRLGSKEAALLFRIGYSLMTSLDLAVAEILGSEWTRLPTLPLGMLLSSANISSLMDG